MKRKDFLKLTGLAGATAVAGGSGASLLKAAAPPNACVLIPTETIGPFPLDLSANPAFFRQDVRENKTGALLRLKLRIVGANNCLPMANVRVNIWHCDKDGLYSGYNQFGNPGQSGLTYLRGFQFADVNGEVEFITIFPGWYNGRICHIHFQVYVSSIYAAISQLTFPLALKNQIYEDYSNLYTKGADPLTFQQDNFFSDGYAFQLASLNYDPTTGGYKSALEVSILGNGISGLAEAEPETGGQFKLLQNFPNPFDSHATIPFTLNEPAEVKLQLFDLKGSKVVDLSLGNLGIGDHTVDLDLGAWGLPKASYAYQLLVENAHGVFCQAKLMTSAP